MARACGLRIGPRHFELFVLDGSARKPKVVASAAGSFPYSAEDSVAPAAAALKAAFKAHNVPRENVAVAIDSRYAAFRRVNLPLVDQAKIEQVIKFEIEGDLPQFNIDEVVVDFHTLESTSDSSSLLVTAVPKQEVTRTIQLCAAAGFEPLEIELEPTAMVNAAVEAGLCGLESAQVLVHVGEESTAVAIVDGARVREMRAIPIGALSSTPRVEAEEAAGDAPPAGEPSRDAQQGAAAASRAAPRGARETGAGAEQKIEEIVKRIRRELARTISGARTANVLEGVYVCGLGLPGLMEGEIVDLPLRPFGVHEIEGEHGTVSAAVAYGVALRQLGGGVLQPRLRREELKFAGAMERLELPFAVVSLLLVTLLGIFNIFVQKETEYIETALFSWRENSHSFMMGNISDGRAGRLEYPSDAMRAYVKKTSGADVDDPERNRFLQLKRVEFLLNQEIKDLREKLGGQDTALGQPQSAFKALAYVLDVFQANKERFGRPSLRKLKATYTAERQGKGESVRVSLDLSFFAADATAATVDLEAMLEEMRAKPWCLEAEAKTTETLDGGEPGIWAPGVNFVVDLSRVEEGQA